MNTESTLVVTKWDAGSDAYTIDGISIASNIIYQDLHQQMLTNCIKMYRIHLMEQQLLSSMFQKMQRLQ